MKQPTVTFEGKERKVIGLHWHQEGELASIVIDLDGEIATIFRDIGPPSEFYQADLDELLKGAF